MIFISLFLNPLLFISVYFFQVARRCLSFLHNGVQELSILDISCPKGSIACWILLSALEVLKTCQEFQASTNQVQQYCLYTAELWSYCREKLLQLGKYYQAIKSSFFFVLSRPFQGEAKSSYFGIQRASHHSRKYIHPGHKSLTAGCFLKQNYHKYRLCERDMDGSYLL